MSSPSQRVSKMNKLKFDLMFQEPEDVEFPEEHTIADLGIAIDDDYLTRHEQRRRLSEGGRKVVNTVHGQVGGLVDWFIENWSYLLWEIQTPFKKGKSNGIYQASPILPGAREAVEKWEDYINIQYDRYDYNYYDDDYRLEELKKIANWHHRHLVGHASSDLAIPS